LAAFHHAVTQRTATPLRDLGISIAGAFPLLVAALERNFYFMISVIQQ
jgi:hypothetical protein